MRIVQKYGGSSVATIEQIQKIASYIKELKEEGHEIVVVASAMGKTTDELIKTAKLLSSEPNKRELDALLAIGELKTISLLAIALNEIGVDAISLSGMQAGFKTSCDHGKAFILECDISRVEKELKSGKVVIVAGFQGYSTEENTTTFGRGGSDTTAVALASQLKCVCEIYTDVESVFTVDPRLFSRAKKLKKITYEEMMESAVNGAKVLDARCVELAKKYDVGLFLGKTLEKDKNKGTKVMNKNEYFEAMPITNLAIKDVGILTISGDLEEKKQISKILKELVDSRVNYEMVGLKEIDNEFLFSFSAIIQDYKSLAHNLKNKLSNEVRITYYEGSKLTLVGFGLATHTKIIENVFNILLNNNINFRDVSISEISVSFVVDIKDKEKAVKLMVENFNL